MTVYSAGKKNPKALRVDLIFTVESPKSVSCDAMTNADFSILMRRGDVDEESSRRDRRYCTIDTSLAIKLRGEKLASWNCHSIVSNLLYPTCLYN